MQPCLGGGRPFGAIAILSLVFLALIVLRWDELPVGAVTDDSVYVELARSLAEGRGPVIATGPDVPPRDPQIFPPGFPLLLAPLAGLFPTSLGELKLVALLATIVLALLTWHLPGSAAPPRRRVILVSLLLLNPWVVAGAVRILSDLPFAAMSLGTGLLYLSRRNRRTRPLAAGIVLGGLAAAALLVRSVGLALLLVIVCDGLLGRRWRLLAGVAAGAGLVLVATWAAGASENLFSEAYDRQLIDHHAGWSARTSFLAANFLGYVRELPTVMLPVFGNPLRALATSLGASALVMPLQIVCGLLLAGAVATGAVGGLRSTDSDRRARTVFFGTQLGLYVFALLNFDGYPSGVQPRLLLPVLPVLYWFLLEGGAAGLRLFRLRRTAIGTAVITVLLAASLVHNAWRVIHPLRTSRDASGLGPVDPGAGAAWIHTHTAPGDVIMAQAPLERHVHFRRAVVGIGEQIAGAPLAELCSRHAVAWIFVGPVVHGPPDRLDVRGTSLLRTVRAAPWARPAYADTARSVFVFRVTPR